LGSLHSVLSDFQTPAFTHSFILLLHYYYLSSRALALLFAMWL
jgi:hypothetical protein